MLNKEDWEQLLATSERELEAHEKMGALNKIMIDLAKEKIKKFPKTKQHVVV